MKRLPEHMEMADEKEEPEVEEKAPEEVKDGAEGEEAEGEAGEEGGGRKFKLRLSYKKLAILAVPLVLVLGVGGYFAKDYVMDMVGMSSSESEEVAGPKVYYTLPEMVVNLSSRDTRAKYLKLKVSLEAPNQDVLDALNPVMPRVLDMFQLYLRELRSSDLEGSAGIYRLKEELLRRINLELHPKQINRVLFNEIIVQ
jgi:flagellar FliL protein